MWLCRRTTFSSAVDAELHLHRATGCAATGCSRDGNRELQVSLSTHRWVGTGSFWYVRSWLQELSGWRTNGGADRDQIGLRLGMAVPPISAMSATIIATLVGSGSGSGSGSGVSSARPVIWARSLPPACVNWLWNSW